MESYIVSTRLKQPRPRKNYIIRQALFSKLDQMKQHKVSLMLGSAGTGKTTLITSYIDSHNLDSVNWISLDEDCNNVFLFWNYIVEALLEFMNTSKKDFSDFFHANTNILPMDELLLLLINGLSNEQEIYLVLDDFHHIKDRQLLTNYEFFLQNAPENLHFIILTRQEPSLYLSKFDVQGELLRVEEEDFHLSNEDALAFLKETLMLPFDESVLLPMVEKAEGWIGGLQLLASATQSKKPSEISKLNTTTRMIREYITNEIYNLLNEKEQSFLVQTSELAYFNKEVSIELFPGIDFDAILEDLLVKNILLQCIDEENGLYRYHNIMGDYLKLHFVKLEKDIQDQIHKKAAHAFLKMEDYEEGLRHLLILEDYESIMEQIIKMPQLNSAIVYIGKVPPAVVPKNFDFAIQKFFYHYSNLQMDICHEIYAVIEPYIATNQIFQSFQGLDVFLGMGGVDSNMDLLTYQEMGRFTDNCITKALIMLRNTSFLFYQDKFKDALDTIEESMMYSKNNPNSYIDFFNLNMKAQVYEEMGCFVDAFTVYNQIKDIMAANKSLSSINLSYCVSITGIYLKQMKLESALSNLETARQLASAKYSHGDLEMIKLAIDHNMIEYHFLNNEVKTADVMLQELMSNSYYKNTLRASTLLKYLCKNGEMTNTLRDSFIETYEKEEEENRNLNSKLMYARLIYGLRGKEKALFVIDDVLSYARKTGIRLKIIEASLQKLSILMEQNVKGRIPQDLYLEAIYYACEDEIKMPFYLEADAVQAVRAQYAPKLSENFSPKERSFELSILKLCNLRGSGLLSSRELEVLKEIALGHTNKEIGECLCISIATVKSHIINIYRKLEVNTRVGAVEAARKLGIEI